MDNNIKKVSDNVHLTLPMKSVMCICIAAMLCFTAISDSSLLAFPLLLAAAALNCTLLICTKKISPIAFFLILINVVPIILEVVTSGSAIAVIPLLYPIASAAAIGITVKKGCGRTVSVSASAIVMLALLLALLAFEIYGVYGQLSADTVRKYANDIFEPVTKILQEYTVTNSDGTVTHLLPENRIGEFVYLYKLLFIGILGVFAIILSYLVTLFTRLIMKATFTDSLLPTAVRIGIHAHFDSDEPRFEVTREKVVWRVAPNPVSAWVFIATYILSFLIASVTDSYVVLATVYNMQLILSPMFIYCGARDIILRLQKKKISAFRIGNFLPIICIILIFIAPSALTFLLSFIGASDTLRENKASKMQKQTENPTRKDD